MTDSSPTEDEHWMSLALSEGAKGLGLTSPNPPVGAVIVKDGELFASGWHQGAGKPHAEIEAIRAAGDRELRGATIYVTLEPCSTHGRTPPCVDAILKAGFARVVVSATDPNPVHQGAGFPLLREQGVEVVAGVLEEEGRNLIRYFAKRITAGRPWVLAKTAATATGKTALAPEAGRWISSEASLEDVQGWRRQCDAILVGGETFRRDNPRLTLRGQWAEGREQPLRVILTRSAELPESHHLFTDEHADRTRVHEGISLEESLRQLAEEGVSAVMLESGGRLLRTALEQGLVDELFLYVAPIIGGSAAGLQVPESSPRKIERLEVDVIGGRDLRIRGRFE
ncbi:MAG: bifunctional diaminohydroxyphosphoribosylaminopyrimidine deaminase/5-amino-6-(5-phosphoribosylamino)uracil reductase RibD [Verrucomicrobiota bacterium]